jgi:ligand-binding sensor domain-containing protein
MNNKLLIFSLSILYAIASLAQPITGITYSVGEGLPQSQVFAMAQDAKGYMWFGTQGGGLGRFDGKSFKTFLPSEYVSAIAIETNKTLWVGTKKGAFRWQGSKFESVQITDNQAHHFTTFAKSASGTLWIGSERGLWTFDEKSQKIQKRTLQQELDRAYIQSFFNDEKGTWIATSRGVFLLDKDDKIQSIALSKGIPFQSICKDANGFYWLISYNQGVFILKNNDLQIEKIIQHPDFDRALCSFATVDGKVWIGTESKGIMQLSVKDTLWKNLNESDNLPSNHIRQIFQDSWNNIWIGTSGGGVTKLLAQNFTHFNTKNGLANDRIYALSEGKNGTIWCAVGNNGVMNYNGSSFQKPIRDSLLSNIKSKSLATDNAGRLWIGSEGDGILLIDSTQNRKFTTTEGLASNFIKSIVIDKNNHIWAATQSDGIIHLYQKSVNNFFIENIKASLPDLFISTLKLDNENRLWFASKNGIVGYLINGKIGKVYAAENGIPNVAIRCIAFDNQGFIYLGTAGEGIFIANLRVPDLKFSLLKSTQYYAKNIYLLQFDKQNALWVGSENGVEKLTLDALGNANNVQHYGKNEGFLGIETCQNAALCDQNGNLWFGTLNGLTRHFPNSGAQKSSVPKVHFVSVNLFYQALENTKYANFALLSGGIKEGLTLPYHQNHLSFDFKGIHLNSDAPMQYRWMLKGAETQWSPLSVQESVNYANLLPGDYVFMVQATIDGVNFSEPISAPFSVAKPFWQMLWFRILALSIIALCIYFLIKYRENKIRAKELILREQLEIKNKLLTLEQKALQLQMNPHFIFNVLSGIQGLIVNQKTEEARQQISNFALLMRNILSNSRKQLITLKEEIETLEGYLQIELQNQKSDFDYQINITQHINSEEVKLPPMLLQPFVENAVIHGIARLERRGKIEINFDLQGEILYCSISDNGIGRIKSTELKGLSPKKHQSAAIDITTERLKAMAISETQPTLQISDILNADDTVEGTKVEAWIGVEVF